MSNPVVFRHFIIKDNKVGRIRPVKSIYAKIDVIQSSRVKETATTRSYVKTPPSNTSLTQNVSLPISSAPQYEETISPSRVYDEVDMPNIIHDYSNMITIGKISTEYKFLAIVSLVLVLYISIQWVITPRIEILEGVQMGVYW